MNISRKTDLIRQKNVKTVLWITPSHCFQLFLANLRFHNSRTPDTRQVREITWTGLSGSPDNDLLLHQAGGVTPRRLFTSLSSQVTTVTGLGVFWKLLFLWKASIYKVVWYNLLLYVLLYFSLSLTYRFLLSGENKVRRW